jgi:hypothetical protein
MHVMRRRIHACQMMCVAHMLPTDRIAALPSGVFLFALGFSSRV